MNVSLLIVVNWSLSWSSFFLTTIFLLYLHQILDTTDWEKINVFLAQSGGTAEYTDYISAEE